MAKQVQSIYVAADERTVESILDRAEIPAEVEFVLDPGHEYEGYRTAVDLATLAEIDLLTVARSIAARVSLLLDGAPAAVADDLDAAAMATRSSA